MGWENSKFTNSGIALVRRCVDTGKSVRITRAAATDETWPAASLANVTTLAGEVRQELPVTEIYGTDSWKRLHLAVTPVGLTEGYQLRQVGIWARGDESETPILMFIMQDETGFAIPTAEEMPFFSLTIAAVLEIDDAGDLVIEQECWVQPPDYSVPWWKLRKGTLGYVTPEMFGAKGDGITDDSDAIQAAIDFAAEHPGSINSVVFSAEYYITKPGLLHSNMALTGNGKIISREVNNQISPAFYGVSVENVLVDGIVFEQDAENGDWYLPYPVDGVNVPGCVDFLNSRNITVRNCEFYAIRNADALAFDQCEHVLATNCRIDRYVYTGIAFLNKCSYGKVTCNTVLRNLATYADDGTSASRTNSYAISLAGGNVSGQTDTSGYGFICTNNYIWNELPHWEGIDAHGIYDCVIADNIIINCATAIAIVDLGPVRYATITGNVCRIFSTSHRLATSRNNIGIIVAGNESNPGIDITIANNIITNFGHNQVDGGNPAGTGGISVTYVANAKITGNVIQNCALSGICVNHHCETFDVSGNTIYHITAPPEGIQYSYLYGVVVPSAPSTGKIDNNLFDIGVEMCRKISVASGTGNDVWARGNRFLDALGVKYYGNTHFLHDDMAGKPDQIGNVNGKEGDMVWTNAGADAVISRPITGTSATLKVTRKPIGYICTASGDISDGTRSQWDTIYSVSDVSVT